MIIANIMSEVMTQQECKKPIKRSIIIRLFLFFLFMSITVGYLTFRGYRDSTRSNYRTNLRGAIDYVISNMDADDLDNCIKTQTKSPKYEQLRLLLDKMVDTFDLQYVYIMVPLNTDGKDSQLYVMESHSAEEYAQGKYRDMFCKTSGDEYPVKASRNFMKAYNSDDVSYFDSVSVWGRQYNATMPLFNSNGERFAIICAEINNDVIMDIAIRYIIASVGFFILAGLFVLFLLYRWISKNITDPIKQLEKRAVEFADSCEESKDLNYIVFKDPGFKTDNELDLLSNSIKRMAHSLRIYVQDMIKANEEAMNARLENKQMSKLIYKDSLTRVKNKAAYLEEKAALTENIKCGETDFGIMMIDANNLKKINDTYGHEHGDEYIVGTCEAICDVFKHSSVYRIGGDEFIVVLKGRDYIDRNRLQKELSGKFTGYCLDKDRKPWQKYSAATGIATYKPGDNVDDVFVRADEAMYKNKQKIKECSTKEN